jgi:hypothetical protein
MHGEQAAETLRAVERLRGSARRTGRVFWFPLILFGALMLVSAPLAFAGGVWHGAYWAVAAPAGFLLTGWYGRRRAVDRGFEGRVAPYGFTGLAILVATPLAAEGVSAMSSDAGAAAARGLVVGAGYAVFAWLERDAFLAAGVVAVSAAAVALAFGGADARLVTAVVALALGSVFLGSGVRYKGRYADT